MISNCPLCGDFFKSTPIVLPCGWTVCDFHVKNNELVNCFKCSATHLATGEYLVNKSLGMHWNLVKTQQNLDRTFNKISEFRLASTNPYHYTLNYYDNLLNEINKREKESIDIVCMYFANMANKVKILKNRVKMLEPDIDENVERLVSVDIDHLENELQKFQAKKSADGSNFDRLIESTNEKSNEIYGKLNKHLYNLLDGKPYFLSPISMNINFELFGKLVVNKEMVKFVNSYYDLF
jgi:hypothetical protein